MKTTLPLLILFSLIALPSFGELTKADLNEIRLIVQEEIKKEPTPIKTKIDGIDTRLRNSARIVLRHTYAINFTIRVFIQNSTCGCKTDSQVDTP